ncbi:MAG TPA: 30S ribosomal protein S20 [Dehalococcoidia bacterium]|nr:30S ribosomal protein S20 [Dehalococcoidia bacterium]
MANTSSAKKRWRQNLRARERNKPIRTRARSAAKDAEQAIAKGEAVDEALRVAASALDRAARKGVIHRNAAARKKSRLAHRARMANASA